MRDGDGGGREAAPARRPPRSSLAPVRRRRDVRPHARVRPTSLSRRLTAAGMAVLVSGLVACSGSAHTSKPILGTPTRSAGTMTPSTATRAGVPGMPTSFVAITWSGGPSGLVVADRASGRVIRTLVPAEPGAGVIDASVTGDGAVYYTGGFGTCAAGIGRVKAGGGGPEIVLPRAAGIDASPSVRSDGTLLAFASSDCAAHLSLVIASTMTFMPAGGVAGESPASAQAWSRDGSQLLTISNPPDGGAPLLHDLGITAAGTIRADRIVASSSGCYYATALFSADGTIVAGRFCGSDNDIVSVDPTNGRVRAVLVASRPGRASMPVSLDASGTYLLWNDGLGQAGLSPSTSSWQVLGRGMTTALPHYPALLPLAWIG